MYAGLARACHRHVTVRGPLGVVLHRDVRPGLASYPRLARLHTYIHMYVAPRKQFVGTCSAPSSPTPSCLACCCRPGYPPPGTFPRTPCRAKVCHRPALGGFSGQEGQGAGRRPDMSLMPARAHEERRRPRRSSAARETRALSRMTRSVPGPAHTPRHRGQGLTAKIGRPATVTAAAGTARW